MFLESILKEVPGQSQRHVLCELPVCSALRPISGNGLSCNLRAAGFLWALLLVWHQEIGMPRRYSHWKFNHTWTSEFRYWRSYPHLILYSKEVFILCGEKWKVKIAIHLRNIQKANKKGKLNIISMWKNGGSPSSAIWEEFLPCWTTYIPSFPLQWRNQAINLWRVRQGARFSNPATLVSWRLYCYLWVLPSSVLKQILFRWMNLLYCSYLWTLGRKKEPSQISNFNTASGIIW